MSEHIHEWRLPDGPIYVIGTYPEQYPYVCDCGAFTHDPKTGTPCQTCAPEDWARRTTDLVTLRNGPFDGWTVPRPLNASVYYRQDEGRVQRCSLYRRSDDRDIWMFGGYIWTVPTPEARP